MNPVPSLTAIAWLMRLRLASKGKEKKTSTAIDPLPLPWRKRAECSQEQQSPVSLPREPNTAALGAREVAFQRAERGKLSPLELRALQKRNKKPASRKKNNKLSAMRTRSWRRLNGSPRARENRL
jgi:hypothetical protein